MRHLLVITIIASLAFFPLTAFASLLQGKIYTTGWLSPQNQKTNSLQIQQIPNDPRFGTQWNLKVVGALEAWQITTGKSDTVIAIIDTGVNTEHEDIKSKLWINSGEIPNNGRDDDGNGYRDDYYGYNFLDQNSDLTDLNGHGTGVASITAAATNNGLGIAGINWHARIMVLKTLNRDGGGSFEDVAEALHYAADKGASVVNMSFGANYSNLVLSNAVEYALNKGVVLVAASGNGGSGVMYPAAYSRVIGVGALDQHNFRASFSNYGTGLEVMAPGVDIPIAAAGTFLKQPSNRSYSLGSGTSFAAAHVAGLVSLLLVKDSTLTSSAIYDIITQSTDLVAGQSGYSPEYGYGRVNFVKALGFKGQAGGSLVASRNHLPADGVTSVGLTLNLTNVFGQPDGNRSVAIKVNGENNIVNGRLVPKDNQSFTFLGRTDATGRVNFTLSSTKAEIKKIDFYDGLDYQALNISTQVTFDLPAQPIYRAQWVTQSPYPTLRVGEAQTFWVELKNTGNIAWLGSGSTLKGQLRLGTSRPEDRPSIFGDESWFSFNRVASLDRDLVLPGEIARFSFIVKATELGDFREYFRPVAEYVAWLNDLGIYWDIKVTATPPPISSSSSLGYEATLVNKGSLIIDKGGQVTGSLWVEFLNSGSKAWYSNGIDSRQTASVRLGTESPRDRNSIIATPDWFLPNRPLAVPREVPPGETVFLNFPFSAPQTPGVYQETFRLVSEFVTWFGPTVTWEVTRY